MERNNVPVGTKERREGRGTVPRPGEMKLFAYAVREFDEKPLFDKWCAKLGVEFAYSTEYPTPENIELARGYDAISTTPYALGPEAIRRFHELGVKYLGARAIGFDHFDLPTAKELGMPVTHVFYPPSGVANYAIMLMLDVLPEDAADPGPERGPGLHPGGEDGQGAVQLHRGGAGHRQDRQRR